MTDILLLDWFNLVKLQQKPGETHKNHARFLVGYLLSSLMQRIQSKGSAKKQWSTPPEFVSFFLPPFLAHQNPRINNNQQQISNQWKHLPFFSDKQKYKAKSSIFLGVGFDGLEFFITLFSPGVIHWRLGLDTSVGKGVDRRPWKFPKRLVWMDSNKDLTPWKFNSSRRKNDGWKATLVLGR